MYQPPPVLKWFICYKSHKFDNDPISGLGDNVTWFKTVEYNQAVNRNRLRAPGDIFMKLTLVKSHKLKLEMPANYNCYIIMLLI